MRILAMVNNFPWPGNIDGIYNLLLLRAIRERGHEIRVLRTKPFAPPVRRHWRVHGGVPANYTIEDIPVKTLRAILGPRSLGLGTLRFQLRNRIAQEIREFNPDVIHVHGLMPGGVMAMDAGVPYVLTAHGTETYKMPWSRKDLTALAREIVARASACAAVSDFVASHLRRLGAPDVAVVFNGADDQVFHPRDRAEARAKMALPLEPPIVLFAGHIVRPKGIEELIAAAPSLTDLKPHFVIAGAGPMQTELEEGLRNAGLTATFLGFVNHEALSQLIAASDVLTLPSHAEGLPTTLSEVMNVGRAIVATRAGGIPEIVHDGETGFLIDVGDVPALTDRLRRVLTDAPLRERLERNALAFAREHLTWAGNARIYEHMYECVLKRAESAARS